MHVDVNDTRLYFDVEGAEVRYVNGQLETCPPLVLLHGGPGYDHLGYKPWFSQFADIAQIIYVDFRSHGRNPKSPRSTWSLRQWGDDVLAFLDALELESPIVLGTSFGGFVALDAATRYPERFGKLILSSTSSWANLEASDAAFEALGGKLAGFAHHWMSTSSSIPSMLLYKRICLQYYNTTGREAGAAAHTYFRRSIYRQWLKGEGRTFDYRADLPKITCPTLVLSGDSDPVCPVEESRDMAAAIPTAELVVVENAGHGAWHDDPETTARALREFIAS